MGGSLALAIRPWVSHLTVVDTDRETLAAAKVFADEVTDDFATGVSEADLIVLAAPVRTILNLLRLLPKLRTKRCMILDLGSSKREITSAMNALPESFQAIGGHPLCGREKSGFQAATPELFKNHTFVLCRNARTSSDVEKAAVELVNVIGSKPLFLGADIHDELLAGTSHLPYLLSAALMRLTGQSSGAAAWELTASGFRDTARLSGSSPVVMLDILLTNQDSVLSRLEAYRGELVKVAEIIRSGDETQLLAWMLEAQQQHNEYRSTGKGE